MTTQERIADLVTLGEELRSRIISIAMKLDSLPIQPDRTTQAVITWRVTLLALIWDVAEAPLTLAITRTKQFRALRILARVLFEYSIRLEYYAYEGTRALIDWENSEAWLKGIVKRGTDAKDLSQWTREERRAYNEMIKVDGKFNYQDITVMVCRVFEVT